MPPNSRCGALRPLALVLLISLENAAQIAGFGYLTDNNNNNNNNVAQPPASLAAAALAPAEPSDTHRLAKRMDLEACLGQFDVHRNTIIRTGESQAIGGKYLQGLELDTMDECQRLCCETDGCDVYVFEEKNDGYCYLFECGPPENFHCKFTRHANYTSAVLTPPPRRPAEATTPPPSTTTTAPTTTTTSTTMSTMLQQLQQQQQQSSTHPSGISQQERELTSLKVRPEPRADSDSEAAEQQLSGLGSALLGRTQVAQSGGRAPNTSASCGRFQFACHSGECIAVYNACDGIPQCEDGSDEGPECSGALAKDQLGASVAEAPKQVQQLPQVSPYLQQQQQQQQQQQLPQQQLSQLQQQQQQAALGPAVINNREDSAAWANRKIVVDSQQGDVGSTGDLNSRIFNHKGGLQVPTSGVATFPNANLSPMYAATLQRSGIYLPQELQPPAYGAAGQPGGLMLPQQQQQQQQGHIIVPPNVNWGLAPQQQQPQFPTAPQLQGPAYALNGGQQQVLQQQLPPNPLPNDVVNLPPMVQLQQQQQQQQQPVAMPSPVGAGGTNVAATSSANKPSSKTKQQQAETESEDEYESENEEVQSTEPPKKKQRKHKKVQSKSDESSKELPRPKDPIELALEQQKEQPPHSQPQPQAQQPSPVHEQYKMIHENLAMEFRDHDGQSERPGGAVLSLTLGLLVTAALAILIGCRMRTVGRRARRLGGKAPYAHEADFLVNGMYL